MTSSHDNSQKNTRSVRPIFIIVLCIIIAIPIMASYFGYLIRSENILKMAVFLMATIAIIIGWTSLFTNRKQNSVWRRWIAMITSIYLTLSLPAFLFELSPLKWFIRNPMHRELSMYVSPWIYWGYHGVLFVVWGAVGSFFDEGRARTAFLIGGFLLLILWFATFPWIH